MSYPGKVQNGVVVFDNGPALPDGTPVRIEPVENGVPNGAVKGTLAKRLLRHAGAAGEDLPTDLARNHDHYLHAPVGARVAPRVR